MVLSDVASSVRSNKTHERSPRLQNWLDSPRSYDPHNGIQGKATLNEGRHTACEEVNDDLAGIHLDVSGVESSSDISANLQAWLRSSRSEDPYKTGQCKMALNERRSALYAKVDEILTAFQTSSPLSISTSDSGDTVD
jgi:hypothetical protein